MNTIAPNEIHHSVTEVSDESTYRNFLVVLLDTGSSSDSRVFDEIPYQNEKSMSDELNDSQKPNAILLDVDSPSDPLSTYEIFVRFDENVSEESNPNDHKSNVVHLHHLITFSVFSIQCEKYV
ncbi:unnamed protein product [Schistosoma haematobium]|nr:unnamed protein product [Schistosoma haematobium]